MLNKANIIITKDQARLAQGGADFFANTAKQCVSQEGTCFVAISGGSTPRAMHRLLGQDPYRREIPWQDVHLFWVDERMVAYDAAESNYGRAKEDLLDHVPIPWDHIHPMPVDDSPEQGALAYQEAIHAFFDRKDDLAGFDLILLGLGQDGHTASLFPGHDALGEQNQWVVAVKGGSPNVFRLTMTFALLNRGRQVAVMASGKAKASVVKRVFDGNEAKLPAQRIDPIHGKLTWFLDRQAASLLSGQMIYD